MAHSEHIKETRKPKNIKDPRKFEQFQDRMSKFKPKKMEAQEYEIDALVKKAQEKLISGAVYDNGDTFDVVDNRSTDYRHVRLSKTEAEDKGLVDVLKELSGDILNKKESSVDLKKTLFGKELIDKSGQPIVSLKATLAEHLADKTISEMKQQMREISPARVRG